MACPQHIHGSIGIAAEGAAAQLCAQLCELSCFAGSAANAHLYHTGHRKGLKVAAFQKAANKLEHKHRAEVLTPTLVNYTRSDVLH